MEKHKRNLRSLRAQIALAFGALAIGLSVLLSWGFGEMIKSRIQRDAGDDLYGIARNAASLLADGLFERSREVQILSSAESIWAQGLDAPGARALLERNQAMRPNSLWIGVADAAGVVRSATGGLLVGQSVRDRPWFAAGMQGLFVGDVHPAKLLASLLPKSASGEPLRFVDFAAPIRLGGQTIGVLGIHGSWDWAREVVDALLPPYAYERQLALFIFDRAGGLIYAPDGKTEDMRASGQQIPVAPVRGDVGRQVPEARVVIWQDGQAYLTSAVQLQPRDAASDLGWQVVARQPVEIAFADTREAVRLALGAGLLAVLVAAVLGWLAAGRLSKDLDTVAEAARLVEGGQAGAAIPLLESSKEVRTLSLSLDSMTRRLLTANQEMDAQVRERTAELEAANRELDQQVRSDPLTGVLNRRGFDARFQQALALARRGQRPLSLVMVDADHFKRVNDSFGHDVGDQVLQSLAQGMQQRLRGTDVVARLGGEEFVALLPDTDATAALAVAQQLVDHMAAHAHPVAGRVTISAGVSTWRAEGDAPDQLVRRADEALYEAKGQGRNRVVAVG